MALPAENTIASGSLPVDEPGGEDSVTDDRARDSALQEDRRRQDIQYRAEVRAQRSGIGTADPYELSSLPDEAGPDSGRQVAVGQNRLRKVQSLKQQADLARSVAQNAQRAIRTARWLLILGEALVAFIVEFWPVLLLILILFIAAGTVAYFSQPEHFAEGLLYVPRVILEPIANFLWGKAGNDQPPATTPTVQPPQSSSGSFLVPNIAYATNA